MSTTAVETKKVVGVCSEITEKNGWTQFSIDAGSQYPVRLSTKLPALIEQARTVGEARSVWTYKESQGKENPNKPGTFFTNRYLEGVQIGDGDPTVSSGTPTDSNGSQVRSDGVDWDAKERRDYRSRAWAQAISAMPWQHQPSEVQNVEEYFKRVQSLQRKIFVDVCGSFAYPDDQSDIPF